MNLNFYVLLIFAPLLVLTGVAGFVVPEKKSLTSGAPAYNVFHIVFGTIGIAAVLSGDAGFIRWFNVGFGLIDLYQAAASFLHLFPKKQVKWTRADDILHIAIGAALVLVGFFGK